MKKTILSMAALAAGVFASAASLSPDEALMRALSSSGVPGPQKAAGSYELVMTCKAPAQNTAAVYVFNSPGGFVLVGADDGVRPFLGSGNGQFEKDNLPGNVAMWLDFYAEEIGSYLASGAQAPAAKASVVRPTIEPMCLTKWDQQAPYNAMCPTYNNRATMTGCAATAMAQIMKHYNHPAKGTGSNSYVWNNQTLTTDYSTSTYAWADMLDEYNGNTGGTQAQRDAVARLMVDCGTSLEMLFSPQESGAYEYMMTYALTKFFGYDARSIMQLYRNAYEQEEWEQMIYSYLAQGMPIQYNGQATDGGHSFVCDGYADGLYHINWGWSGMYDGYFALSALNPEGQGTGGHEGGYNYKQNVVVGIRPTPAGQPQEVFANIVGRGALTRSGSSFMLPNYVTNNTPMAVTIRMGIEVVDVKGEGKFFISEKDLNLGSVTAGDNGYFRQKPSWSVTPTGLAKGIYSVYPAVEQVGLTTRRLPMEQNDGILYLTVDEKGGLTYSSVRPVPGKDLKLSSFATTSGVSAAPGVETEYTLTVTNNGTETYEGLLVWSVDAPAGNNPNTLNANIPAGGQKTFTIKISDTAGLHHLYVADYNLNEIPGSPADFLIGATEALIVPDAITTEGSMTAGDEIEFGVKVVNRGAKEFDGTLTLLVKNLDSNTELKFPHQAKIAAGAAYNYTETVTEGLTSGRYMAQLNDAAGTALSGYTISFDIAKSADLQLTGVNCYGGPETYTIQATIRNEGPGEFAGVLEVEVVDSNGKRWASESASVNLAAGRTSRQYIYGAALPNGTLKVNVTDPQGRPITGSGAEFTITNSGIESAEASKVIVSAAQGTIVVEGLEPGAAVAIVDAQGRTIASLTATGSNLTYRPATGGIYIVVTSDGATKLSL